MTHVYINIRFCAALVTHCTAHLTRIKYGH